MSQRADKLRLGRESATGSARAKRVAHLPPHAPSRCGKRLVTNYTMEESTSQAGTSQAGTSQIVDLAQYQYQHHQHPQEAYQPQYQQEGYQSQYEQPHQQEAY